MMFLFRTGKAYENKGEMEQKPTSGISVEIHRRPFFTLEMLFTATIQEIQITHLRDQAISLPFHFTPSTVASFPRA